MSESNLIPLGQITVNGQAGWAFTCKTFVPRRTMRQVNVPLLCTDQKYAQSIRREVELDMLKALAPYVEWCRETFGRKGKRWTTLCMSPLNANTLAWLWLRDDADAVLLKLRWVEGNEVAD